MKWLKKLLRLTALAVLITLASVGIGISGGAPVPVSTRKENGIEIQAEELHDDSEADIVFLEIKT